MRTEGDGNRFSLLIKGGMVLDQDVGRGGGENSLDSGWILKVELTGFHSTLEVGCKRKLCV